MNNIARNGVAYAVIGSQGWRPTFHLLPHDRHARRSFRRQPFAGSRSPSGGRSWLDILGTDLLWRQETVIQLHLIQHAAEIVSVAAPM